MTDDQIAILKQLGWKLWSPSTWFRTSNHITSFVSNEQLEVLVAAIWIDGYSVGCNDASSEFEHYDYGCNICGSD
jgi:hypothetical protein